MQLCWRSSIFLSPADARNLASLNATAVLIIKQTNIIDILFVKIQLQWNSVKMKKRNLVGQGGFSANCADLGQGVRNLKEGAQRKIAGAAEAVGESLMNFSLFHVHDSFC